MYSNFDRIYQNKIWNEPIDLYEICFLTKDFKMAFMLSEYKKKLVYRKGE